MPFINSPTVFYEGLEDEKYDNVKANILKRYINSLENSHYPMGIVYPNRR
jgi:hypothetical protein